MSDSEFIKIDIEKGTLTIQMIGKDPLVVTKDEDYSRAAIYAKSLKRELLVTLVDHTKKVLSEPPLHFSSSERARLSQVLKAFEQELASRPS